jgi:6-phosphogluconolactonase
LAHRGRLDPLPGSTRPLSGSGVGPAEVSFDYDGDRLVVTEKNTNLIDSYKVGRHGVAQQLVTAPSSGATPFGFAFGKRDRLFVSEAFGGAVDQSALSSYRFDDGLLTPVTRSLGTTETAACWVVVTDDSRYTYATNTGSASVTGYRIGRGGDLTLLNPDGKTANTGATPIDVALSSHSRFLYELSSGSDTISGFRVEKDGSLTPAGAPTGTPDGAVGLAAE